MSRVGVVLLLLLAGCGEPRCRVDTDCPELEVCADELCVPLDLAPALQAICAAVEDCSAGELCVDGRCEAPGQELHCFSELDPFCEPGTICTVDPAGGCQGGEVEGCPAPLACLAPAGPGVGLSGCELDGDCASGLCLEGSCLQLCSDELDCRAGSACFTVPLSDGRQVRTCRPVGPDGAIDPARTYCLADRQCAPGRRCRYFDDDPFGASTVPWCEPPGVETGEVGQDCGSAGECPANLCVAGCLSGSSLVCNARRCTIPCELDSDCPPRFSCQIFTDESISSPFDVPFCGLPGGGCFDDVDCCPQRAGDGGCLGAWGAAVAYCSPRIQTGRLLTGCEVPEGTAAIPGEPCTTAADCITGLCLPEPSWAPGRGSLCTSACHPLSDRCAATLDPASACAPGSFEVGGLQVTLDVCQ